MQNTENHPNVRRVPDYMAAVLDRPGNDATILSKCLAASLIDVDLRLVPSEKDRAVYKGFARYLERLALGEDFQSTLREIEDKARSFCQSRVAARGVQEDVPSFYGTAVNAIGEWGYARCGDRLRESSRGLKRKINQVGSPSVEQVGSVIIQQYLKR